MKSNFTLRQVSLIVLFLLSIFGTAGYFYVTKIIEDNNIQNIIKSSKEEVKRLQIIRGYYTKFVVGELKKNAKNIQFSYDHENSDTVLPFPTTVIHDLTKIYSARSDVKIELYSDHPFLNRKDRVLTPFQKKAIAAVEKDEDGIFYEKNIMDGKKVLRVAVADYMILPACVNCHNNNVLKDWPEDRWKLGDKRGILEIITPLE